MNPILVGFQDVYGASDLGASAQPSPTVQASGSAPTGGDKSPAMFWVGMIGALVLIRLLWQYAKKA